VKILAIRGLNLASLYGEFEVNLAAEPFASAGLFAITGATGAGKSTLLDALCLALFDRTPRLDGKGGALVGQADQEEVLRVRAEDVRGLLSRGRGSGFAEVDFASRDGYRWRARWEVRRARERADGRLQPQTLLLLNLDSGDRIGGTKTEVLAAIVERVGLSFEQFRRSALLAQGDFAAFLHADPKERAELLEKVTGTAIYTRLSEAAFARAKVEREALESLAQQRAKLGLLNAEERQELEQEAAAASAALIAAQQVLKTAEATVRWYVDLANLQAHEDKGRKDHTEASGRWEQARERRQNLDFVKAAQPLRWLVEQQDLATQRRDETRQRVAHESDGLEDARQTMTEAEKRLAKAREAQERAKQERDTKEPELDKAALLDHRLEEARRETEEASTEATAAGVQAREATEKSAAITTTVDEEKTKLEAAEAWLKDHPHAQALSATWNHLEVALREHAQALGAAAEAGEKLPTLEEAAAQAAQAAKLATTQAIAAEEKLEECQQAVDRAERAVPEGRQERIEEEQKICQRRRDALRSAEGALAEARRAQAEQERAESAAQEARKAQQTALEAAEQTRADLRDHGIRLDEAEHALSASQAIRDLEDRRTDLVDGEPCPLCGSTSHPFRHHGAPSDVLASQQQRLHELKEHDKQLTVALATAEQEAKAFEAEEKKQTEQAANAVAQLAAPRSSWAQALETLRESDLPEIELPETPLATGAATAVENAMAASQRTLADLEQLEQESRALEKEAREGRKARDLARTERDNQAQKSERAKELERRTSNELVAGERRQNKELERLSAARKSLGTSLGERPGWQQELETDGEAFRAACQDEVVEFQTQTTALEQANTALAELQPKEAKVAAEAEAARVTATAQEEKRRELLAALDELRQERGVVLGGQTVADVKRDLERASTKADKDLDLTLRLERKAQAGLEAAEARLEGTRAQLQKEASALEGAQQAMKETLTEHKIDLETLRQRLRHDAAWCETETRALDAIQQSVQAAASVLAERRARREEQESTDRPEISEVAATAQKESATEEHRKAEETAQDRHFHIRKDDGARAEGDALTTKITSQESLSTRWATLNDVIGSRDGHKFRKFAQGLTLDSLLGYANAHLRDLAPRYRLARVPGEDLELQVIDLDMGDEVRSINSLSGGETFLASLALALGLSSLSSSDTPVESLFIDEGFGTLDLETLEIALSALDALQAWGRQVGVISHVQDLGQRIGVQVQVIKVGAGRSRVETIGGP